MLATAGKGDSLTVSSLGTSDANDVVAGEDLEGGRVNTLLVDHNEVLVGAITKALLEFDDLENAVISELTLRLNEFLSLVGIAPEESGIDFSLFIFEGDVEAHNVAVLELGGHVTLSATVIEDKTTDELGLSGHLVLHVHNLDHMEIKSVFAHDAFDGIDDDFGERVSNAGVDLGVEGVGSNADKEITGDLLVVDLEVFEETERLLLGLLQTVNDDSGMDSFTKVALSLTHELSDEKNIGCGAVADDVVLSGGSSADHGSGWVLDLHLVEQNTAVLGQLDLTGAANKPTISNKKVRFHLDVSAHIAVMASALFKAPKSRSNPLTF